MRKKAVEHNNRVHNMIKGIYSDEEKIIMDQFKCPETEAKKMIRVINSFYEKCGVSKVYCYDSNKCLITNVIRADAEVTDAGTMKLLKALNVSYYSVRAITERGK